MQLIDPIGATTTMSHDSRGLRRRLVDPDTSNCGTPANCPWLFAFDDRGQLASQTDAKGQVIQYQRDELGRIFLKDYVCTSCSEVDVTFSYDGTVNSRGLLDVVSRGPSNVLSFVYLNWPGRVKNFTQTTGDTTFTTHTNFDFFGRMTSLEYPTGELAEYFYNGRGALNRVTFAGSDIVSSTTYDALSRFVQLNWGNGLSSGFGYGNDKMLLDSLQVTAPGATHLAFGYRHDANGNPVEMWEDIGFVGDGNWKRDYFYDWANRLDLASHFQPQGTLKATWDFGFNNSGNITFNSDWNGGGLDGSYAYTGAGPHAVTRVGGPTSTYTLAYDLNGSLTTEGLGNWFEYNFDGRTSRMGDTGTSPDPVAQLTYDGLGDRRVRKVWSTATGTKDLRYFGALVEELVEGVQRNTDKYVMAWGQRVAMRSTRAPGKTYFLHGDMLGSVSLVSDEAGAIAERRIYTPFGAPQLSAGSSAATRYGFTGQELDDEVGQLHLGIRQYGFAIAKFGVGDPIGLVSSQGLNPYSYANNQPSLLIDPSGYQEGQSMDCPGGWACPGGGVGSSYGGSLDNGWGDVSTGGFSWGPLEDVHSDRADLVRAIARLENGPQGAPASQRCPSNSCHDPMLTNQEASAQRQQLGAATGAFLTELTTPDELDIAVMGAGGGAAVVDGPLPVGDVVFVGAVVKTGGRRIAAAIRAAQKLYPGKVGKQLHHIKPKYLGGPANGATILIDSAYHQQITNAFRAEWAYGQRPPDAAELEQIMERVYSKYPLPK